ncbi:MAG: MFS transporter [Sphingomonadales bacterium]|nr:MAG: MFS transporter [Sphingomonadales bacterium]
MDTDAMNEGRASGMDDRALMGHPAALLNIISLETLERFSFYGMQAILILYLYYPPERGGLGFTVPEAISIVGGYAGTVYLASIAGALVADRILGAERTLFLSGVTIMVGHTLLAILPGISGVALGCACVALGAGGVKATASALVGRLYEAGDGRRDAGFSIFYAGITLGAFAGPLITGWSQANIGFHYGFGAAAIGMAIGLIYYLVRRRRLAPYASPPAAPMTRRGQLLLACASLSIVTIVLLCFSAGVLNAANLSRIVATIGMTATVAWFLFMLTSATISADERARVIAFMPIFFGCFVALALSLTSSGLILVYADKLLDRNVAGYLVPAPWAQSANSLLAIGWSVLLALLWRRGRERARPAFQIPFGLILIALAYLSMVPVTIQPPFGASILALLPFEALFSLGLIFVYPLGLAVTTRLAPPRFYSQFIAAFYLSISLGSAVAGWAGSRLFDFDNRMWFFLGGALVALLGAALCFAMLRKTAGIGTNPQVTKLEVA